MVNCDLPTGFRTELPTADPLRSDKNRLLPHNIAQLGKVYEWFGDLNAECAFCMYGEYLSLSHGGGDAARAGGSLGRR